MAIVPIKVMKFISTKNKRDYFRGAINMLSLIFSIRFWCKRDDRNRAIAAIVVSGLAPLISLCRFGLYGLADVAILVANIIIYLKSRENNNGNDYYY